MKKILIFVLVLLGLLVGVNADDILGNVTIYNQTVVSSNFNTISGNVWSGQPFNYSSVLNGTYYNLSKITVNIQKNTGTGNIIMEIKNTSSNLPTGSVLCTVTKDVSTMSTGNNDFIFTNCSLNFNNKYVYYMRVTSTASISDKYTGTNPYTKGDATYSNNAGSSWTVSSGKDLTATIYGIEILSNPTILINNPLNNSYYNNTNINLNLTLDKNSDIFYNLNNNSFISLCQNCNSSSNITLNSSIGLNNLSIMSNYSGIISYKNISFTIDTTTPIINNNILAEYNYYTNNNLNSSCSDTNLLSCNITINSENVALNTTNFNFTTNGNQTYNITATDLAGNSITQSGVTLVNPYQTFRFYDYLRLTDINNFYIDGVLYSNNYTFKTYNYGLGNWDFSFNKEGYVNQTFNFTLNDTSNYNFTNNVTAVTIIIKAYNINTLAQIPFNLTLSNGIIAQYYNQVNFTEYYNNTPQGEVTTLISSAGYNAASYNINIGAYSALTLNAYLLPINDSTLFQFTALSQETGATLSNVDIEVQELINTSYITVSSKLTGDNGKTYFYLDNNKEYKIIFSKNGYVTATAFTIPTVTTYTVKLTGESAAYNYVNEISYLFKPTEFLLKNNQTYDFTGFISGDSITSSNFSIVLNNGTTIYTNSNVNPTGTTYNYNYTIPTVANFTQITMTLNYIINGELFTASKDYKVITLNEDSFIKTMQNFGNSNTEESNLWKWFIVMTATILVLISSVFLGTVVPLLIIPLWVFFSFVGWIDFTYTAVVSVVALIMFLGGRR